MILVGVVTAVGFAVRFCVDQLREVLHVLEPAGIVQSVAVRVPKGPLVVKLVVPPVYAVPIAF